MNEDNDDQYYKDPSQRLLDLVKDEMGSGYEYFLGVPSELPEAAFPCIVVQTVDSSISAGATGFDQVIEQVDIVVMVNSKDDLNAPEAKDTTLRKLNNIIQGRSPTGAWLTPSIMHTVRKAIALYDQNQQVVIGSEAVVNYDVKPTADESNIMMGIVTMTLRYQVPVPDR